MKFNADKKNIVISGGSQGLGKSLAKEFVKRGANVTVVARTESKLKSTVQELEELIKARDNSSSANQRVDYISADVSDAKQCQLVFQDLESRGIYVDYVLCCAGNSRPGMFVEMDTDTLAANLNSVYNTALYFSHAGLKHILKSPDFVPKSSSKMVVFCSSVLAVFPLIGYSAYSPAKFAVRALADILRQECLQYGIHVAQIIPGNMDTEGFEQEEKTKPAVTKKVEGASVALDPDVVAQNCIKQLLGGEGSIYTDFIGWVLGSSMLGLSPRSWPIAQSLVAVFFAIFGPLVRWFIYRDIRGFENGSESSANVTESKVAPESGTSTGESSGSSETLKGKSTRSKARRL